MARYEVLGSDGHTYEVEASTPEAAAQAVNAMLAQQQAGQPSLAQDVGMAAASGLPRGIASALDLPGQATGFVASQAGRLVEPVYEYFSGRDLPTEFYMQEAQRAIDMISPFAPQGQTFTGAVEQAAPGLMAYEPATTTGEFVQTGAEFAPGMIMTPGGALARTMYGLVAPTIGAELGERGVEALGGGEGAQLAGRIGGSILAPGLLATGQRLVSPYGGVSPQRLERAALLEEQGIPLQSGQVVGSQELQMLEDSLTASPDQLQRFTAAVVRSFGGQPGDDIGAVLRAEERRIGDMFDDVTSRLRVDPTSTSPASNPSQILTRLQNIATEWGRGVQAGSRTRLVEEFVEYFDEALSGGRQITAEELMRFRSQLSSTAATTQDAATRQAAVALVRELDGVIDASLRNAGDAEAISLLNTARQQWRDFLAFEAAATRAGQAGLENAITPQALAQALRQQDGTQYVAAERGLFGDLARSGEQILRPAPAVSAGGQRVIPEVAEGQTAQTLAITGGGGGPSALMAFLARMARPARRFATQDPLGQMYLRNQLLGAPEYIPFSGRVATYSPLAALGGPTDQQ